MGSAPTKQLEDSDRVQIFYRLDGGALVPVAEFIGQTTPIGDEWRTIIIPDLKGSTVTLVITMINSSGTEKFRLDNITVRQEFALKLRNILLDSSRDDVFMDRNGEYGHETNTGYHFQNLNPGNDYVFSLIPSKNS